MTKIKKCFVQIVLLLSATILFGQQTLTVEEQNTFKQGVQLKAKQTTTLRSDFMQTKHIDMLDNDVVSKGILFFSAPENIRWEYTLPTSYTVIFKDEMLYVNNNGKKDEIKLSSNKLFRNFTTLIIQSVNGTMFDETQFNISYFKQHNGYKVRFIPKEKRLKRFVAAFELIFSETSFDVTQVKIIEPNDDYTLVVFQNRKSNVAISEAAFKL